MTKYSTELKKKYIDLMLSNKHSNKSAAMEIGVSLTVGKRWWLMYNKHGFEGLIMKSGSYDGKFKVYAVEYMHKHHLSINEASAELGIPSISTLRLWERKYYEQGADGLLQIKRGRSPKNMEKNSKNHLTEDQKNDLVEEVQRLRAENAYLKKYNALVQEKKNLKAKRKQK